jgi:hypothetical protein
VSAALGARLALGGLTGRAPWVAAGLGLVLVEITSLLERSREPAYAADRALLGAALGVVVPLVCYALFEAVYRKERAAALLDPLGRHGADRRHLSLGINGALLVSCTATTAVLTALTAIGARGFGDRLVLADAFASLWGGALVGAGYAGLFSLASRYGRRGRIVALVLDWLFGSSAGLFALPWPRAHARSLFGGEPVLDSPQLVAAAVLAMLAFAGVAFAAARESR